MKVNAISFGSTGGNYKKGLETKKTSRPVSYAQNPVSSATKAVPLVVLLATSPLSAYAASQYNSVQPQVVQTVQDSIKITGKKEFKTADGEEFCRFIRYSTDGNSGNTELVGFNYNCYTDDNNIGIMNGIFQGIMPQKTDDNKYLVTYEEIKNKQPTGKVKTTYIPEEFGNYLLKFANSKFNNNAVDILNDENLTEAFGEDYLESTRDIREEVTTLAYPGRNK